MKKLILALLALIPADLPAADLTTRDGQIYHDYKVIGHDTGYITIMYADGGGKIPLSELPADLQVKYGYDPVKSTAFVAQETAADRQARAQLAKAQAATAQQQVTAVQQQAVTARQPLGAAPTTPTIAQPIVPTGPLTGFPEKFNGDLIVMRDGKPEDLDTHLLAGVKYWAFYYSASWCPPCRAFTPQLVNFYRGFKPAHPNFELIFVNDDQTEDAMLSYMRGDGMPWPAVRFSDIRDAGLQARKYCGEGIPCLVLVDADGRVLSDTYRGGQYMGPEVVVDDIKTMVK